MSLGYCYKNYSYEKLCVCNLTSSQGNNMAMVFGDVLFCRLGRRALISPTRTAIERQRRGGGSRFFSGAVL
jgi:hypothetical protein